MARPLLDRYLEPARVLPLTPSMARRVGGSILDSWRAGETARTLPSAVGIDISDACNIACTVCSREIAWDKRRHPFLSLESFRHLYDQIRPAYLSLSGYGETTLNKYLPEMVAHAAAQGSRVGLITNGTLLDTTRAQALLEAGLAKLKVSIDAADPEVYALHRAGADLEVVLGNVERMMGMRDAQRRPGPLVELQLVIFRENVDQVRKLIDLCHARLPGVQPNFLVMFTYGEQAGFTEKALPMKDPAVLAELDAARALATKYGFRRTLGSLDSAVIQLTRDLSSAPCFVPWYSCLISTDGDVYACCHHTIRGIKLGNALELPFADIWNGASMQAFRRSLKENRCADNVCATCRYEDGPMARAFGVVDKVLRR